MNITIVGASGYGNFGDDVYVKVLTEHLPNDTITIKNSDEPRVAKSPCDLMIIGGGGLIYEDNTAHFDYMKDYMENAIDSKIPYMLISVGIQSTFASWVSYLKLALAISVRSEIDRYIMNQTTGLVVPWFPDLAYLFDSQSKYMIPDDPIVFIPGRNIERAKRWENVFKETPDKSRVILRLSPTEEFKPIKEFFLSIGQCQVIEDASIEQTNYIISHAKKVYSHRYHGCIMARKYEKPFDNVGSWQSKIIHDVMPQMTNLRDAIKHIELIEKCKTYIHERKLKGV